ncbi:phosphoribosylformylglycinamidine synthase II [Bradyrhizobium sp. LM3.4]
MKNEPKITPELIAAHGLKPDEYERILKLIGREPTFTELGIFSAMWNEHCSYKSSRLHLKGLPTKAPWVIQGPGENAGVIDIGDGQAVVFKMESHNHPSYIEPYQGATTGVGGILRDVFTMGARPIACLNALSFGAPEHARTRHLVSGVVAGVGGYGNSFGVPTVGGQVRFHTRYDGNILVNAMAVGLADTDKIFYAAASGVNMPIVYLGSKTGRDGIHGASMASAEFDDKSEEKRPTVQVGDPFAEKLLLEACLEIMESGCVIAIQDMGAAGLTCSAVEMGAKGDLGVDLDLDAVPTRESGMSAYEMMLSESQERMLMVLKPEKEKEAEAIFKKWGLDFAVVGYTTPSKRFVVKHGGDVMADLPIKELGDEAPLYDRPHVPSTALPVVHAREVPSPMGLGAALEKLIGTPELCSKRWVWEQYDPRHSRQHHAASWRRCRRGARAGRPEGLGADRRRDAALLRGRSLSRRHAGGGRSLAQHHRRRRQAARDHRQSQFRQSRAARDHGPVRRLPEGHLGSLPHARLPGRLRQCLALQRDQRPRDPADALDRRRRPAG